MAISVVINTYNAEQHLEKVLKSVKDFDEILICDMHSTDSTREIAEKYSCRIIFHDKIAFVEPARNFAIQSAVNEWVLLLDADETVSKDLKEFLRSVTNEVSEIACVAVPRKNYFLGKFMQAAYPDYVYRFFRKEKIRWPEFIHSQPIIDGDVLKISPDKPKLAIEHLANDSISAILNKNNEYSTAEIDKRKHKTVTFFKLVTAPFFWFLKFYVLKKGFLDGIPGFIFAILKSQYKFCTLAKVYEYRKSK